MLSLFKLTPDKVKELRVARWGHPINLSLKARSRMVPGPRRAPIGERIHFCEQDNWPAPCIETASQCALDVEGAVRKAVTG